MPWGPGIRKQKLLDPEAMAPSALTLLPSCFSVSQSLPRLYTVGLFQFYVISTTPPLIKCDCSNFCDQGWPGNRDISCLLGRAFKSKPAKSHVQRREGSFGSPVCCIQSVSPLHWVTSQVLLSSVKGWESSPHPRALPEARVPAPRGRTRR